MQMLYRDHVVNLLDTPGHKDFSEDTYRVLTAVDAALMVIDAANGVEAQTRRLIEVCRQRDTPIITFVNKMDREVRDPLDILDEVERELGMPCCPMTWPVGQGKSFGGIIDLRMRPVDGLEFTRQVRGDANGKYAFLPIIMLTGYAERSRVEEARDAGVTEFIVKPVTAKAVLSRLQNVIYKPRPFVQTKTYFGPDRRRRADNDYAGPSRRKTDGLGAFKSSR